MSSGPVGYAAAIYAYMLQAMNKDINGVTRAPL
jgi:hypothetical protein